MKAPLQPTKSFGSAASLTKQLRSKSLLTIPDNRPTALAQRKLQVMAQARQQAQSTAIQRKITVGTLEYTAEEAETLVQKHSGFSWSDNYRADLVYLDKQSAKFKNVKELTYHLDYNLLEGHLFQAIRGQVLKGEWVPAGEGEKGWGWQKDWIEEGGEWIEQDKWVEGKEGEGLVWREKQQWAKEYEEWETKHKAHPGEGKKLIDLVYNAIVDEKVISTSDMDYDNINKRTPDVQLAFCLKECRDSEDEEEVALCLYTSYFYGPLNRYFRGLLTPDESTAFGKLLVETAKVLRKAYAAGAADKPVRNRRCRLELQSDWLKDGQAQVDFKALTSTHPGVEGVKAMWDNVADGAFGPYGKLTLLVFEETTNTKCPKKKYFSTEEEHIMGPDTSYKVIDSYTLEADIPRIGKKIIRIIHLGNTLSKSDIERLKISDIVTVSAPELVEEPALH